MDDTIWPISPHTAAKHHILKRYLEAWAPILLQRKSSEGVLYIDGFAGPGKYAGNEPGSPIIAMKSLINHTLKTNFKGKISFYFIEQRKDRAQHLEGLIKKDFPELPEDIVYKVSNGEFNQKIKELLDRADELRKNLRPCFCFVDPFGWNDLDYNSLGRIMKYPKAELFITFMAGFLNRFKESEPHKDSMTRLYSDEQIKRMKDQHLTGDDRQKLILRMFVDNLKEHIKEYTTEKILDFSFSAYNGSNNLSYYLVHLTKSCKGKEAMKEAMFNVKKDGNYSFTDFDFDPRQTSLVSYFEEDLWVSNAANDVFEYFKNLFQTKFKTLKTKSLPVDIVKKKITCDTKWIYRAPILAHLEASGKIAYQSSNHPKRRAGQFPEPGHILFNF